MTSSRRAQPRYIVNVDGTDVDTTNALPTKDGNRVVKGYEAIADVSTATALTVPSGAKIADIQAIGNDANWRDDGTNPVVNTGGGMVLAAGTTISYKGDLSAIKFIEKTAGSTSSINISYYA